MNANPTHQMSRLMLVLLALTLLPVLAISLLTDDSTAITAWLVAAGWVGVVYLLELI